MLSLMTAADLPSFPQRLWQFIGVLHPATVHFPVALLLISALFILLRRVFRGVSGDVAFWCLILGAAGAAAAAAMGWSFAPQQGYGYLWDLSKASSEAMSFHRWGGIFVAALSVFAAALAILARFRPSPRLSVTWQIATILAAVSVGLVGHWGGEAVYGVDYLNDAIAKLFPQEKPAPAQPVAVATVSAPAPANPLPIPPKITIALPAADPVADGTIDFTTQIKPLFEKHCVACHNEHKHKGKLSLADLAAAAKGGEDGPGIVPGHSDKSHVITRMVTDDEEDLMPPKDKGGPLPKPQIQLVRKWIDQGANWPKNMVLQDP